MNGQTTSGTDKLCIASWSSYTWSIWYFGVSTGLAMPTSIMTGTFSCKCHSNLMWACPGTSPCRPASKSAHYPINTCGEGWAQLYSSGNAPCPGEFPSFSTGVNGVVGRLTGWPTWAGSRTCSHQVGVTLTWKVPVMMLVGIASPGGDTKISDWPSIGWSWGYTQFVCPEVVCPFIVLILNIWYKHGAMSNMCYDQKACHSYGFVTDLHQCSPIPLPGIDYWDQGKCGCCLRNYHIGMVKDNSMVH